METLHILTESGYMDINIDEFFPCTKESFRKVFKIIHSNWKNDVNELIELLKVNFQKRLVEEKDLKESYGKKYVDAMQKKTNLERRIKEKKRTDGSTLTKDELEVMREEKRHAAVSAQSNLSLHNRHTSRLKRLEINLQLLEEQRG